LGCGLFLFWHCLLPVGIVGREWIRPPVLGRRFGIRIDEDAIDGAHRGKAFSAPGTKLGDDDDVESVVEDGAKLRRAMTKTRIAIDAGRHVDSERRVLPLFVADPVRNPVGSGGTVSGGCCHGPTVVAMAMDVVSGGYGTDPELVASLGMAQFAFLSAGWIQEARKIRDQYGSDVPAPPPIRLNLTVTEVPFDEETLEAHIDTTSGVFVIDQQHLDGADVVITADYVTTKSLFVGQDPAAVMQAFMSGKIRVQGDLAKLLALQASIPTDVDTGPVREVAEKISAMTTSD
jgi:putative sterol carrier protein